ncbi:polysaccharide pyruvyl transferase family protein, partial [Psychroflexus sp. MES1-P1E]|uniref:polysaccharide pyruvyl transferase family protein n=1 Tax=Psychroflexus sp. MES1-P1E TaxID=2058320 RepID=UPI000C796EB1
MITLFNVRPKGHNIGNDAISIALRNLVYEAFGRMVNIIDIPATSLYESHSKAGLSSKTIYEINRVGDGVIVGGGNLYENNEIDFNGTALEALEVPLMLFSNSLGKVYDRKVDLVPRTDVIPDSKLASLHSYADISLVRDSSTLKHLQNIGSTNSIFGGCPTIFLGKYDDYKNILPKNDHVGVLISIRTPSLVNLPQKYQLTMTDELTKIIRILKQKGYKRIRLLCNDARDCEYASYFRDIENVDFVYTSNVFEYLSLLSNAELVVSYRLHATLPSLSFGTPVINISYDERAEQLLEDLGIGSWDIKYVKTPSVSEAFKNNLENIHKLNIIMDEAKEKWDNVEKIQHKAFKEF